jgi:CRP/FNR family transcriptional regulator, cyclic AMP receptor protein
MISPELLRRFPFFAPFNEATLREIAMLADQVEVEPGSLILEECGLAQALYLLLDGNVDLYYKSEEAYHPKARKELLVGEINPGEIFGISSLIEPYVLNASARATQPTHLVRIEAAGLRKLFDDNPQLGYVGMQQLVKVLSDRLIATRVQLAAAWA